MERDHQNSNQLRPIDASVESDDVTVGLGQAENGQNRLTGREGQRVAAVFAHRVPNDNPENNNRNVRYVAHSMAALRRQAALWHTDIQVNAFRV